MHSLSLNKSKMEIIGKISEISWKFEWAIEDFFAFTQGCSKYLSPHFPVGNSEWYLCVFPNGETRDLKGYVSVFLWKYKGNTSLAVEFDVGIKTSNAKVDFKKTGFRTFDKVGWGWKKFIERSELLKRKSELLPKGILTITCFVKVLNTGYNEPRHNELAKDLKSLFISKQISDVTLHVQGGSFEVHRSVLSARSPVFAAMFRNDTLEKKTGVVEIPDAGPETFNVFLFFLYSGEIELSECNNIFELYRISHKYDVSDLKLLCVNFIIHNISAENFGESLALSHHFDESELRTELESFFSKNFRKIVCSAGWEALFKENGHICNSLLKSIAPKVKILE